MRGGTVMLYLTRYNIQSPYICDKFLKLFLVSHGKKVSAFTFFSFFRHSTLFGVFLFTALRVTINNQKEIIMKRLYFVVMFVIWYIWLSIMPSLSTHGTLKEYIVDKISYRIMVYYITTHGVITEIVGKGRSP